MRQIFFIAIFQMMAISSYGQFSKVSRFALDQSPLSTGVSDFIDDNPNQLDGSPYYSNSNEWKKGLLYFVEEEASEVLDLRYNLFKDLIEVKFQQDSFYVDNSKIHKFKLMDDKGEFSMFFQNGYVSTDYEIEENDYFEILYTGKTKLVVDITAEIKVADDSFGATKAMVSGGQTPRDRIVHEKEFYLYKPDGKLHWLSLKKKEFLKEMGEHQEKVETFMKKNKLKTTKPEELVEIISYFDSL
ncbi:MAG: hypothetical protein KTR26_12860 [Flammeovirgaceae bacterium]|nr:hypothetical protein [Flammeovirgaceae bacterium]